MTEQFLLNRLISSPELEYPLMRKARVPGRVIIDLKIDTEGTVVNAQVVSGHPILDELALRYVRACRFVPLRLGAVAAAMSGSMTVWFDFALKGVTGLYLPTIKLVDGRQFEVQGRKMDRDDLLRWLEQYKLRDRAGRSSDCTSRAALSLHRTSCSSFAELEQRTSPSATSEGAVGPVVS